MSDGPDSMKPNELTPEEIANMRKQYKAKILLMEKATDPDERERLNEQAFAALDGLSDKQKADIIRDIIWYLTGDREESPLN